MKLKYLDTMRNFELHLQAKTELMPSTVKIYVRLIKELTRRESIDPPMNKINEFIGEKLNKRQTIVVYAIKRYLKFRWRNTTDIDKMFEHTMILEQLVKVTKRKIKPPIRKKKFLKRDEALKVISSFNNLHRKDIRTKKHKLIATIQYFTGGRASEIIGIKKEDITKDKELNCIKIDLIGKGEKRDPVYIDESLWPEINEFFVRRGAFLFLDIIDDNITAILLRTKIESAYKRYYEDLKEASTSVGIEIATHDWRRSFAQSLKDGGLDIFEVKKALRHVNIETTQRYFDDNPEKTRNAILRHQKQAREI